MLGQRGGPIIKWNLHYIKEYLYIPRLPRVSTNTINFHKTKSLILILESEALVLDIIQMISFLN